MTIAQSRLTAQGQISVPAQVRKKLGIGPGSMLEWVERGDEVVVRRAGRHTSAEVHATLFSNETRSLAAPADIKEGIRKHMRRKHARG